jgi:hypothetical protein
MNKLLASLPAAALVLAACGKGDKTGGSGSGSAAEPAGSGSAVPIQEPPPNATFSQTITSASVGPLTATTDPKIVAAMFPGMDTSTKHEEGEDHSSDDTTVALHGGAAVLHVIVDNMRDPKTIFRVDVVGSMFATQTGIRVGSTVADFAAKYSDAECRRETYDPNPENFTKALLCEAPAAQNLTFYLDPNALTGPDGKVATAKLAGFKIERIIWHPPRANTPTPPVATGSGAGSSATTGPAPGQPFCFDKDTEFGLDRVVTNDETTTFCGTYKGNLTCVQASLSGGTFVAATGPTPEKQAPAKTVFVSDDGTKKLKVTSKAASIVEAKTNKDIKGLAVGDKDFSCIEGARYLGDEIFGTASMCDKPRTAGYLFSPAGEPIGGRIDGINLQDAKPFHVKGGRWAFHSADAEKVLVLDAPSGDAGAVDLLAPDQIGKCCPVKVTPSIPPFALTPKGKLVSIGAALAVIDLASGKAEHAWLLPVCK